MAQTFEALESRFWDGIVMGSLSHDAVEFAATCRRVRMLATFEQKMCPLHVCTPVQDWDFMPVVCIECGRELSKAGRP
jgi:hypothetical protein